MQPAPNDREIQIGQRLREFRESKRISRTAFALSIGIGAERLASYETGRVPLRYSIFRSIADQYALNPLWLVSGRGDPALPEPFDLSGLNAEPPAGAKFSQVYDDLLLPVLLDESTSVGWYLRRLYNTLWAFKDRFKRKPETMKPRLWVLLNRTLIAVQQNVPPSRAELRKERLLRDKLEPKNSSRKLLTEVTSERKTEGMTEMQLLLKRLKRALEGMKKGDVARKDLHVPLPRLSEWLSGRVIPSGETTLRLVHWVEQQERKPNTPGSAMNTAKGKTQVRKSPNEKQTQVRNKG